MARRSKVRDLLACALVCTPLMAVGCGDDNGGDDDDDVPAGDAGDAGDGGARPPEGGIPEAGRPDGGDAGNDIDGSMQMDGAVEASVPDATVQPDGTTPLPDGSMVTDAGGMDGSMPGAGDTWGITSSKRLVLFSRTTGALERATAITGIPDAESVVGADVRPADRTIIALTSAGKLYTVDPTSGMAVFKSTLANDPADGSAPYSALAGSAFAVDFNPVVDRLRIVSNSGQNLRVNVDTGATITDGTINPATPGLSAAAYTNNFAGTCRTQLYAIDATARTLLLQDPPNNGAVSVVGSLGDAAIGTVHSFEIFTGSDGTNLALVTATATGGERIAQVNLSTGALSGAQTVALNAGERLDAVFALPPTTAPGQQPGELVALTAGNKLVTFNRGAPSVLCSNATITGLASGETGVGIDVRPTDGALYLLSSTGKLYTVAPATGAVTAKSTLAADAMDTSEPFTALAGEEFGVGFNPVADRLRVVSSSGQNLRINVDSGATTTDSALTPGTPVTGALAYTNSFAGARSTTLFAINAADDTLVRIGSDPATGGACPGDTGNPNCGVVTSEGGLNATADVTAIGGLDIDPANNTVLAAVTLGDATTSTLYTVNLDNGDLSLPTGVSNGTIGGTERVRGLALLANPTLTVWAVTATNRLIGFAPSTPGTLTRDVAITGLQASENIVGIDVRPVDGRLYGVGSSSRLYSIDTTSGAATLVAALVANGSGAAITLPAVNFGVDFSPAFDQLRLVNVDEGNWRVIPSARPGDAAGETFTDTALNPPSDTGVSGAAYTNSFAGADDTTLFVMSGATLYRQGGVGGAPTPSAGALTEIGPLGVTATGNAGFDIAGGQDGLALAALSVGGAATGLYSINLTNGTATPFNAANNNVGGTGDMPLRGLAITLR
jgi:trimeric autotransporter adhesin